MPEPETRADALDIEARIELVRQRVAQAAATTGRDPADVTIVAVSKSVDRAAIDRAHAAGLRHFGENRVQDARIKLISPLPPDAKLHMIGQLQSNKAKHAVELFDWIESVDRPSLVAELEKFAAAQNIILPVLLQVNVAGENQKAGCATNAAQELAELIVAQRHLDLRGLMTIAPLVDDAESTRPVFRQLRELRDHLQCSLTDCRLPVLSMGMTNDFPVAVEEGATHVRIGRAIFG